MTGQKGPRDMENSQEREVSEKKKEFEGGQEEKTGAVPEYARALVQHEAPPWRHSPCHPRATPCRHRCGPPGGPSFALPASACEETGALESTYAELVAHHRRGAQSGKG